MSILLRILAWVGLPSWVAPLFILAVITGSLGGAYIKGRLDSSANCHERELKAIIASMQRDRQAAIEADKKAKAQIKNMEQEAKRADEEIAKYEEELRNRPDSCSLTVDDVNRLRGVGGR